MGRLKGIALVLATGVLVAGGYAAWYVYGSWPVPDGYSFPRHSAWGEGPTALFEGDLQVADGCIQGATDFGAFSVVWPPGYRLTIDQGEPVIHGGTLQVRTGERVRMGGGYYETGEPPPGTRDLGTCPPPYFLSTGFVDD